MNNESMKAAERAVHAAQKAVEIARKTGDQAQLAKAYGNLAQANLHAKDPAKAFDAAVQAQELFDRILGPEHDWTVQNANLANMLKDKIETDFKQGIDWRRTFTCTNCGDRFPWALQWDAYFKAGLDFVQAKCRNCGADIELYNPRSG